jgi:outer membrane lipoprotein-sorting protein
MRRRAKIFLSAITLILFAGPALSAPLTVQEVLAKMQAQEAAMEDLQFDLHQVITFKELKEKQNVMAKVIYKKPDLLYVEYTAPNEQLVIANKDDMVMYAREKGSWQETMRQKISNLVGKQWKADYGVWTTTDLEKNYDVKVLPSKGGQTPLSLQPREKTYNFTMTIFLDQKTWLPVKTLWEDDNQLITTDLNHVKLNTKVNSDIFKFKP